MITEIKGVPVSFGFWFRILASKEIIDSLAMVPRIERTCGHFSSKD
jgi:hypothetical protein